MFFKQKLEGVPLTVVGDGTQRRDFLYVTDVANAFRRAGETDVTGEIFNLGGGDPVELIRDYYDRLAAVHWKDSKAFYRDYTGPTPTKEMHQEEILYKDLGAGGVDHPEIWSMLVDQGYEGWITLDLDPPRPNEGEGTVDDKIGINCRYLTETLKVPCF